MLYSFDVFDTLLTRRVGDPLFVFSLVAQRLRSTKELPVSEATFVECRINSERRLNASRPGPATLHEIYAEVLRRLVLSPQCIDTMLAAELATERELSLPVPGAARLLEAARAKGPIAFISDTPLPEDFLRELLAGAGLARPDEPIFASAERGASKAKGDLFPLVANTLGVAPSQLLHTGDSRRDDLGAARLHGWRSAHRPQAQLNRYERRLSAAGESSQGLTAYLAGASRMARLQLQEEGAPAALADVASGVMAPLLVGYALWVAARARLDGVQRLYFVSRDGEVMLRAAKPLLALLAPELECRYLYSSRQAWTLAGSALSDEVLSRWVNVGEDFTARTALARVHLTPEEVALLSPLPFLRSDRANEALNAAERRQLGEALMQPPLVDRVRAAAQSTLDVTLAYFEQEGLTDGTPSALVDAGWLGNVAKAFDDLIRHLQAPPLRHYFVGLGGASTAIRSAPDAPDMESWLFDFAKRLGGRDELVPLVHVLVEVFCSGSHGRVIGYERKGGSIVPLLANATNDEVLNWGLGHMRRAVDLVVETLLPVLGPEHLTTDIIDPIWSVMSDFWTAPTAEESQHWGTFPWEDETWPPFNPLAQSINTGEVAHAFRRGHTRIRRTNSWRAGSAAVSSQPWRAVLRARAFQQQHGQRVRRIPRRLALELVMRWRR